MIIFNNWQITAQRCVIARQFDNLSRRLEVVGELPEGYTWDLLVQVGNALDIITLEPMEGGVGVTLTADQLSQSGYYSVQLRGTKGEEVRHTNVESVFIPASLSGSGQWPTVPSEFIQAEQRILEIATHPPVPGENGFWMLWDPDADQYAESQLPLPEGGGGGTSDHSKLSNRDAADQHPMSSITGLEEALDGKQPIGDYLTDQDIDATLKEAGKAADAAEVGKRLSSLSEEIVTTSESKVSAHNTGTDTHSDIRLLIQGLTDRLNALADSDDTTLDQLSEVVAYIKSNRNLIGSITTDKVSVADIVDNLNTNVANKPLSAAQGVALKTLINAITIPEKLPNPNALTFTGAVTGSYDGSSPLEVEIPSGGGGITVTNTASVGQTVKITAVDENGKPTEWEAVDMENGGNAGLWEHICDITTTEELDAGIEITKNEAGILLSDLKYNEIFVLAKMVGVSTNTNQWWGCWCYPHLQSGTENYSRYANGAVSGGTTSNKKYTPYYFFIRGGKMGWTDASNIDPYDMNGFNQKWNHNFLDQYNFDYFETVVIPADSTRVIGVDTEIRVLGRHT